jgi:orotate phosphoribosyltransferase
MSDFLRNLMTKKELASQILKVSKLYGTFKLRSGQISNEYFDKYLFESNSVLLREIAEHMSNLISNDTEILAGLEMGGIPIATALSLKLNIPSVFVRKAAKEYGTKKICEGTDIKDKNVLIIEDVVTTGGQIIKSAEDLKTAGAKIIGVICVIERDHQGRKNLKEKNLDLISLFNYEDLK